MMCHSHSDIIQPVRLTKSYRDRAKQHQILYDVSLALKTGDIYILPDPERARHGKQVRLDAEIDNLAVWLG